MKRFVLNLFLLFVSINVFASAGLYSGGVSTYDISNDYIALHSHGVKYKPKENKVVSFSFIELINKDLSYNEASRINDTPKFNALKWSEDERFLVGLSNIKQVGMPNIVIYSQNGKLITTESIECSVEFYPFFCTDNQELHWSYEQLNDLKVIHKNNSLEIYLGPQIIKVHLP